MGGHFCPSLVFLPAFPFPSQYSVFHVQCSYFLLKSYLIPLFRTLALYHRSWQQACLGERDLSMLHLIPPSTAPAPSSILFRRVLSRSALGTVN